MNSQFMSNITYSDFRKKYRTETMNNSRQEFQIYNYKKNKHCFH